MSHWLTKSGFIGTLTLCICLSTPSSVSSGGGSEEARKHGEKDLKVKLIAKEKALRLGDNLVLRVEITNDGAEDIYVLQIVILKGPAYEGEGTACAADCFNPPNYVSNRPVSEVLTKQWILLPRGYSYTGEVRTDYTFRKVGRNLVGGTYTSGGFVGDCYSGFDEQLKQLNYEVWAGEVKLNPIWVEVTKSASKK